ncbi:MAG TPA: PSD1 and planctomycete cytochrome C domain-containing protein [Blastocatellia bacterium]|nr:PSD1 and planctomycete cytochrome C domain-containing protein [Blastocatellia bacterium]
MSDTSRLIKIALAFALLSGLAVSRATAAWGRIERAESQAPVQAGAMEEFFEKKIRPIFANSCQRCHNSKAKVAGLDLTTAEAFRRGGDNGPLINREKPEESRLLKVIGYDGEIKMPPSGKLKDHEITALAEWVKMGAPWPGAVPQAAPESGSKNPTARSFTEEEKGFWAYQPVKDAAPPQVKDEAWAQSPIDRFILQKLEEKKLKPAPPADKLTLLRRATFDLTGLPPTEAEMRDFLADQSSDAFKKVVERLLASPRYGERWGRHWLDVARYADSTGNDEDHRYPYAWKYRDYVIESFNAGLPYDQFIREQVAGDLFPAPGSASGAGEVNRRGVIATGFLALGPKAIAQQDKKKMLYDVYDEQVDVTTRAFLGLTVSCARCHDHKFDPILTKDYYAMIGMFASTRSFTNPDSHVSDVLEKPLVPREEFERYKSARKAHQAKEIRVRVAIEEIVDDVKESAVKQHLPRLADYFLAARKVYKDGATLFDAARQPELNEEALKRWVDFLKPGPEVRGYLNEWNAASPEKLAATAQTYQELFQKRFAEWQEKIGKWRAEYRKAQAENKPLPDKPKFEPGDDRFFNDVYFAGGPLAVGEKDQNRFATGQWSRLAELRKELAELKASAPKEPEMACAIEDGDVMEQKVFVRGDYNNPGEPAPKAFPAILARFDTKPSFTGSGRLQLAEWLTQPRHPLTARVMVNRIWQWHFSDGLVRTPDNFGKMGERPTHPELLDYLATQFVKNGWSMKTISRMIMLSSAYQMASVNPNIAEDADPDNRLLTRFNRRRLSIEEMRDGLLAIDGTLDLAMGGTLQTGRGTDGENNQGRLSLNPEKLKRRTVYLPLRRANLPTLLNLFDFGDATTTSGKRQLTNVATQALFWLNSEFLNERAQSVAGSLLAQKELSDAARVEIAYARILNRNPGKDEVDQAVNYVAGFKQKFAGEKADQKAWQSLCRVLMSSNDFVYVD